MRKCYIGCYELRLRYCTDLQITDARKQLLLGSQEIQTEKILRPLLRATGRHQITLLHRFTDNSARKQLLGSLEVQTEKILRQLFRTAGRHQITLLHRFTDNIYAQTATWNPGNSDWENITSPVENYRFLTIRTDSYFEGWHFAMRKCYIGCYELRLRCCTDLQITDARKQLLGSLEVQTEKMLCRLLRTAGSSRWGRSNILVAIMSCHQSALLYRFTDDRYAQTAT
ncbi:hypothetical protein T4D_12759 [Trichinella pseudospiralis]|uniref:Uncharacterized protein n=1 Tax=Trichinella pseudospiralis TaxID=6337 RepID=A0A0V1FYL7_TRIPS|nr:hypothetical protein T4D_12759 [Trichinella pseudospiralis]